MMDNEKNPYENGTIDIPNFVEDKKEESSSIDMSIFKNDEELFADLENDDDDDFNEDGGNKSSKKTAIVVILAILAVLLLAVSIVSIIGKASADKKVAELTTEVETLKTKVTKYETTISAINQELASKEEEIKKLKETTAPKKEENKDTSSSGSSSSSTSEDGDYHVVGSEGVNLREEPSLDSETVGSLEAGKYFEGYGEEKDSAGNLWVKTYEGYYACMKLADGTVLIESK